MVEDHPPPNPPPPIKVAIKARVAMTGPRMTAGTVDTTLAAGMIAEAGEAAVENTKRQTDMLKLDDNPASCHPWESTSG